MIPSVKGSKSCFIEWSIVPASPLGPVGPVGPVGPIEHEAVFWHSLVEHSSMGCPLRNIEIELLFLAHVDAII